MSAREHRLLLLRLVHAKADVGPLLDNGLTYTQISQIVGELLTEKLVRVGEGTLELTDLGMHSLFGASTSTEPGSRGFISPLYSERIKRIGLEDIYLPPNRSTFFESDSPARPKTQSGRDGESPS
jgi:hypothetical protein